jgi:hypothetical protein
MDLITALLIFFGMASLDSSCDPALYNSLIENNQDVITAIYQDPSQLDLMRQIDRRED